MTTDAQYIVQLVDSVHLINETNNSNFIDANRQTIELPFNCSNDMHLQSTFFTGLGQGNPILAK
jgi:hypothetical protein